MKKAFIGVLVIVIGIACITCVFAAEKAKGLNFTGEVVSVDLKAKTVTVKAGKAMEVFHVVEGTTFGKDYKLETLKAGETVAINYEIKKGVKTASSVTLEKKAAPVSEIKQPAKKSEPVPSVPSEPPLPPAKESQ